MKASVELEETDINTIKPNPVKYQRNFIFGILIVVAIAFISFLIVKWSVNKRDGNKPYSIAVLPFKNLSDDKSNQYFADGVMDDILNHLSTMKEFSVISRTTMEQYRETNKTIPEIAKELKVSYIIESSIQKYKDSIMIFVQMIDAKKDKHIWSKKFGREFKNIFALESDIAKQIAKQLKITLSPEEIKQIDKTPTKNLEAYNLYLRGRHLWNNRTEKDLNRSIYYYNKALELDSTYALAYAGLSDTYLIMAWWGWYPEDDGFHKAKILAKKALTIDNNISEAHTTIGYLSALIESNWNYGLKETKLAVSLNPSNATAQLFYAELLDFLGRKKEARKHIEIALNLNPYHVITYHVSSGFYYRNFEYEKALEDALIALDLANDPTIIWSVNYNIFRCYFKLGKYDDAVEIIKVFTKSESSDDKLIDELYHKEGIKSVIFWFTDWMKINKPNSFIKIAGLYMYNSDTQSALNYLEKGVKTNPIPNYNYLKYNADFKSIRDEPRFQAILSKLNLAD